MDKKLFEELKEGLRQMADHAAGKEVKGVREIVREVKPPTAPESKASATSSSAQPTSG